MKEYELPPLEEDTQKRIMKYFAGAVWRRICLAGICMFPVMLISVSDMELRKRKSDVNLRSHNAREKMFEEEEKAKVSCILK